jgi:regulator of sigma E protease
LKFLKMMVTGKVSSENISGPIGIAQYAKDSFDIGLMSFLSLLAILSISIGILNLLPIPMLDGGHLLNYFFEFILRRPLSEGMQIHLQKIGLIFIIFLTFFAFYNDISKLIT